MDLPAADIHAAAERLRGQVVHTPVIGDVLLRLKDPAGGEALVMSCPRLKAECLQTGGTIEYRGGLHFLLRQLGASKGLVIGGRDHRVLGCARAGQSHRLPMVGIVVEPATAPRLDLIRACGCELEAVPRDELGSRVRDAVAATGFTLMPHAENMDFALGIATAGLELGAEHRDLVSKAFEKLRRKRLATCVCWVDVHACLRGDFRGAIEDANRQHDRSVRRDRALLW